MNTRRRGWAASAVLLVCALAGLAYWALPRDHYLVGAYYYGWYSSGHWEEFGHVGRHLPVPLEPCLGEYNSRDAAVIATHVRWAAESGIDFFIVSFSGEGTVSDRQTRNVLLPVLEQSPVRQAPMLEMLAYGAELDIADESLRRRLAADLIYLARHYLLHPAALRIDGRPVLFLYVTRRLRGGIEQWMDLLRQHLRQQGVDAFLIADEAFWQKSDPARLRAYDAITAYNVYDWPLTRHRGWASESTFFADVDGLYQRWYDAARREGVAFVPNIMPGYNDRGVRPDQDHYVIPRQLEPGGTPTGFFERFIDLAQRYVDPQLRMVTITSFNEWHEWTQIEPTRRTAARHAESDPERYTQGFPHGDIDFSYLDLIRERFGGSAVPPPLIAGNCR